jgi:cytochrome c553
MKKALLLLAAAALVALVAGAIVYGADVEAGKAVFKTQKCSMCHSIAGVGGKLNALDEAGKLKADDIKKWVRTPKAQKADTKMMAYAADKLSDKDLDDLVAYLLTLKK